MLQNRSGKRIHTILNYCIAAVWLANGLFCKVLNMVPRHEQIVARILGAGHSRELALLIGLAETGMAIWILTRIKPTLNAMIQIVIVASMNLLEYILVSDLLLWGRWNAVFACLFIIVVYCNDLYGRGKEVQST